MAYNFTPLEYSPFAPSGALVRRGANDDHADWQWTETPQAYADRQAVDRNSQSQGYSQEQFGTLFDAVNQIGLGLNQYTSGQDQAQRAEQARQSALARQAFQSSLPQAPQMNFQQTAQPAYTGGGWGQQSPTSPMAQSQTPAMQPSPMATYRGGGGWGQQSPAMQQAPIGTLGTTNRGSHGGILGGKE